MGAPPDPYLSSVAAQRARGAVPILVPGEAVLLLRVALPVKGRARRLAALPFALEERLPLPMERMHVALAPGSGDPALAAAIPAEAMAQAAHAGAPLLPEPMVLPRPEGAVGGGSAWAAWCAGGRVVVRASDGTGFALPLAALPATWRLAGEPALDLYGEAPDGIPARVRADLPPAPEATELGFDLRQGAFAPASTGWGPPLRAAAFAVGLGLAGHLAIAAVDARALSRIAEVERAAAVLALAEALPGAPLDAGPDALIARLAPSEVRAPEGGSFLPLLAKISGAAEGSTLRRLTWSKADGALRLRLQADSFEALQGAEAAMRAAGLTVESGVATAQGGGAEVEMRVSGP